MIRSPSGLFQFYRRSRSANCNRSNYDSMMAPRDILTPYQDNPPFVFCCFVYLFIFVDDEDVVPENSKGPTRKNGKPQDLDKRDPKGRWSTTCNPIHRCRLASRQKRSASRREALLLEAEGFGDPPPIKERKKRRRLKVQGDRRSRRLRRGQYLLDDEFPWIKE